MATTGQTATVTPAPDATATRLQTASLVRILTRQTGDAIAAAGLLGRALTDFAVPFQITPTASRAERARRAERGDREALTVAIGAVDHADITIGGPQATTTVTEILHEATDHSPDPLLALAGCVAGGITPDATPELLGQAEATGLEQQPGVGVPTTDLTTGLAATLWLHGPFSGRPDRVETLLSELGIGADEAPTEATRQQLASLVAIAGTNGPYPEQAAATIERALHPYVGGPFETIAGYAEILSAVSRDTPGVAIGVALGSDLAETARSIWASHAMAAHQGLRAATTERYGGLYVLRIEEGPAETIAALAHRVQSPEPTTLVVGPDRIAVRGDGDMRALTAALTETAGGTSDGTRQYGMITDIGAVDHEQIVKTAREVL